MKKIVLAAAAIFACGTIGARADQSIDSDQIHEMINAHTALSEACAMGLWPQAYNLRDEAVIALEDAGWCWGQKNEGHTAWRWRKCTRNSNRFGRQP